MPLIFCLMWIVSAPGCGSKSAAPSVAGPAPAGASQVEEKTAAPEARSQLPTAPVMTHGKHARGVAARLERRDADRDVWGAEVVGERTAVQLSRIGSYLAGELSATAVANQLAASDFHCGPLRPTTSTVFSDAELLFKRDVPAVEGTAATAFRGPDGLRDALEQIRPKDAPDVPLHVKFKTTRVAIEGDEAVTESRYHASGPDQHPVLEQTAVWTCRWKLPDSDQPPQLLAIAVSDFEAVSFRDGGGGESRSPLFEECTTAVLGNQPAYADHLRYGVDHWRARIQTSLGQELFGHQGIAVADVNGDGLEDLYVCQPGGLPNRLFVQHMDGTAEDVAAAAGVDILDATRCSALVDLDNDGDQDLALLSSHTLYLFANDTKGHFDLQGALPITSKNGFSLAVADYDNDGLLDIYICGYSYPSGQARVPRPYHDANNGYPNRLFRSLGDWKFADVTEPVGLDSNNRRYSFAGSWEDYDNDGDLDLYVANDYGRNNLYRNDNGKFKDVAAEAGVEDISAGMAVTWGDYNRDGQMDIHVSNMFSSAGNRVTYQRQFRDTADPEVRALYQRHARGNSLFENVGDGTFRDVSLEMGITMGRWAWGSHFVDLNNDGLEDLVVANGNLTGDDTKDL